LEVPVSITDDESFLPGRGTEVLIFAHKKNGTPPPTAPPSQKTGSVDPDIILLSNISHVTTARGRNDDDIESTDGLDTRVSNKLH
jgi:hypothetical protein